MRGDLKITCYESGSDVAPLIVTFSECFLSTDPPRTDIALSGDSTYAVSGNYIQNGTSFELPAFWTVNVLITEADCDRLLAIWELRESKRRSGTIFASGAYRIELDDETAKVYEFGKTASTKTRSAVSGTTVSEADKGVYYFARRVVDMPAKPILGKIVDGYQSATFTLKDVGIKI